MIMKRLLTLLALLSLATVQAKRPKKRQEKQDTTLMYLSLAMIGAGGGYLVYDKYFIKRWRRIQMNTPNINTEFAFWDEDVQGLRAPKVPYIPGRAGSSMQDENKLHAKHVKDVADYKRKIQENDLIRQRKIERGEMTRGRANMHKEIELEYLRALERLTHAPHRNKTKTRLKQNLEKEYQDYLKNDPTLTFDEFKRRQKEEHESPRRPLRRGGDDEPVNIRLARLSESLPQSVQENLRRELNIEIEEVEEVEEQEIQRVAPLPQPVQVREVEEEEEVQREDLIKKIQESKRQERQRLKRIEKIEEIKFYEEEIKKKNEYLNIVWSVMTEEDKDNKIEDLQFYEEKLRKAREDLIKEENSLPS